ncbi:hypothetical protein RYX36_017980 [Vicia faba]
MEPVSFNRILLETDAPDAVPNSNIYSLFFVEGDTSLAEEIHGQRITSSSTSDSSPANSVASEFATGVAEEVDLQLSFCSGCGISEICIVGKQVALVLKTFLTNIKYVGYIRINYCNQSAGNENHDDVSLQHQIMVFAEVKESQVRVGVVSKMVIGCESNWVLSESCKQTNKEDEPWASRIPVYSSMVHGARVGTLCCMQFDPFNLEDLVPCVLLSFDNEQVLIWRGKEWKSMYPEVPIYTQAGITGNFDNTSAIFLCCCEGIVPST